MPEPRRERDPTLRLLGAVLSFGWVLPACLAAGGGLGWLLDRWLGSFPAATALLGLLGLAGGLRQLVREADALEGGGKGPPSGPGTGPPGGGRA
ncbi:MAG: AtpZ/AtpI family protein [Thermoanaerobaculia bacterium]|nr:AtpZ/AtpI family protein [Thermoanaerobaculia bacterium]